MFCIYDFLTFHIQITLLKTFLAFFFQIVHTAFLWIKVECVFKKARIVLGKRGKQGHDNMYFKASDNPPPPSFFIITTKLLYWSFIVL